MAKTKRTTAKDVTGQTFCRLTALEPTERRSGKFVVWRCVCACGSESLVTARNLISGNTKSCGCLQKEGTRRRHGASQHRGASKEYSAWCSMLARCRNPNNPRFKHYGGRGISVCERWQDSVNFLNDMGPCPPGLTLERKDRNGNYSPDNCVWADYATQNRNTGQSRYFTFNGETLCLQDWCQRVGISRNTFNGRLKLGWPIERILTEPRHPHHRRTSRKSAIGKQSSADPGVQLTTSTP